jgi:PhnB protein
MSKIVPYLRFNDGKAEEAFNFYKSVFGGELMSQKVSETPMAKDMPADKQNLLMHVSLRGKDLELAGSDMMRDVAKVGDNISITYLCSSEKELNDVFGKLKVGGEIFMEPEKTFWDAIFGVVTDKYGIEWMLNCPLKK